jgi:ATP/maltotriose-dependent transcriptional regulator MalT
MKARKSKDLQKALQNQGFESFSEKDHHQLHYLVVDGKKQAVFTYVGKAPLSPELMEIVSEQLKFSDEKTAESFFSGKLTTEGYVDMLKEKKILS